MIIQNCTDYISKCNKVYFDYQNPCVRYNKIYLAFFKNITCYVFKYSSKKSRPLSLLLVIVFIAVSDILQLLSRELCKHIGEFG